MPNKNKVSKLAITLDHFLEQGINFNTVEIPISYINHNKLMWPKHKPFNNVPFQCLNTKWLNIYYYTLLIQQLIYLYIFKQIKFLDDVLIPTMCQVYICMYNNQNSYTANLSDGSRSWLI